MAEKETGWFGALFDSAGRFVESQKAIWDHTAWLDFLAYLQKKGFELTDDIRTYIGTILETMKRIFEATVATKGLEKAMADISAHTLNFLKKTKGVWDQKGWESFLKDLQEKGINLTDETRNYLGRFLETSREIYVLSPLAGKKEAFIAKGEMPVVKDEVPVVREEVPVVKEEVPVVKEEVPAVKEEAPVAKEEAPAVKEEMPATKEQAPVVKKERTRRKAPK
jgi:hypothetical protein